VVLPSWFLFPTGFHFASKAFTPTHLEDKCPSRSSCLLAPGGIFSQQSSECTPVTKEMTNHHFCNPIQFLKKCCGNLELRYRTLRQFIRMQSFIVPTWNQQTRVQSLSLEDNDVSPYISLQAGYRSKKQSSTHIWLHVTSLAMSFPQCYVTFFMFQFFKFLLSVLPSLLPACLFLIWPSSLLI
jgi:hypothetical protein